MKTLKLCVILLLFNYPLYSQWHYLGLSNKNCNSIKRYGTTLYAATNDGLYSKSISSSDTSWQEIGFKGDNVFSIVPYNNDTLLVCGDFKYYVSINISYDGGKHWQQYLNNYGNSNSLGCVYILQSNIDKSTLFASDGGAIVKSNDFGKTWNLVFGEWGIAENPEFICQDSKKNGIMLVGGSTAFYLGFAYLSYDEGENWTFFNKPLNGNYTVHSMCYIPTVDRYLMGINGRLFYSDNNCESWDTILEPFSLVVNDIQQSAKTDMLYAAGSMYWENNGKLFFYSSSNNGLTWDTITYDSVGTNFYWKDKLIKETYLGITTNEILIHNIWEQDELYFATNFGVYKYSSIPLKIENGYNNKCPKCSIVPSCINDNAEISFQNSQEETNIYFYDSNGVLVRTEKIINANSIRFKKNNLKSGMYYLKIEQGDVVICNGKFIIK